MSGGSNEVKETEYSKELANIATEKWAISQQQLQPLEDMMIADTQKGITAEMRNKVNGAIGVSTQKSFGDASNSAIAGMAASGVDPTSGKFTNKLSDISRAGGESRAASMAEGEAGLQANQISTEMNLLKIGSGEASDAQSSLSDVAKLASQKAAAEAQLSMQNSQGNAQLAGTLIGAAGSYYGSKQTAAEFDAAHAKKFGVTG